MAPILCALFLSGAAALVNQTVWQRALKVYLAGSEAISAMIVVLVFMLGLGAGSLLMGRAVHRLRRPLFTLAVLEATLGVAGAVLAVLLTWKLGASVYAAARLGLSVGMPLEAVYAISATAILLVPCLLMGMTVPLAAEVFQRELDYEDPAFVAILFFVNTGGAVLGAIGACFLLLPLLGQEASLFVAVGCNGAASVILFAVSRLHAAAPPPPAASASAREARLVAGDVLGFAFGFLSLAYEMYLFRAVALAHRPLPYNFGLALGFYLLAWSLGVFLAKRAVAPLGVLLPLAAASVSLIPAFHAADVLYSRHQTLLGLDPVYLAVAVYVGPCVLFGWLFGATVARIAQHWGSDVGRFSGLNTVGSCLGILAMTLVGYEFNHAYAALLISIGYLGLDAYCRRGLLIEPLTRRAGRLAGLARIAVAANLLIVFPLIALYDFSPRAIGAFLGVPGKVVYYGKGGVVEISERGDMTWDGLWHSALSVEQDHVGGSNWMLATIPWLCHRGPRIERGLVIGVGTGITAATLARSSRVDAVDCYEVNTIVRRLLHDYPEGTLRAGYDPKIDILWQDGRAGLALNPTRYDLITQQPLWLIQAGSSFLLSREYMALVSQRLKPGGVFCVYAHTFGGNEAQADLVRKTVASVFRHTRSFGGGYMIVASNEPFDYSLDVLREPDPGSSDPLVEEMRGYGVSRMAAYKDPESTQWLDYPYVITDDLPLVEYPWAAAALARSSTATLR